MTDEGIDDIYKLVEARRLTPDSPQCPFISSPSG